MTKLRIVLALLLVALVLPVAAEALSDGCLPIPLPTTPTPPVVADTVSWGFGSPPDRLRFHIWRQTCADDDSDVVLLQVLPVTKGPGYFCDKNLQIIQGGHQFNTVAAKTAPNELGYCNGIYLATTFALEVEPSGGVPFNESQAFTLVGVGGPESFQLQVPASGPTPPAPTLTVEALGCTTCHPGDTLGFQVQIVNPGPPILVELKAIARLPDASEVTILDEERTLATGVTVVPLFTDFVLPAGVPPGDYVIEAAIIDPALDVTISEDSEDLTLAP